MAVMPARRLPPTARLNDDQLACVDFVVNRKWRESRDAKVDVMRKALEWYRKYNMYTPEPKSIKLKRRARVSSPQGFTLVEFKTARQKAILFPANENNPILRAFPTEMGDVDDADLVEDKINFDLRKASIRRKGEVILRNINLFGVSPVRVFWRREIVTRTVRDPIIVENPFTGENVKLGLDFPELRDVLVYDGADLEPIDIEDFYPDPAAREFTPGNMRYVVVRSYIDYELLRTRVYSEPELWDAQAFELLDPNDTPPPRQDDQFESELTRYHYYPHPDEPRAGAGVVELLWYFSRTESKVVANQKVPIANMENPYWISEIPVLVPTLLPITNYPWGKGKIEPIDQTLSHMNSLKNARLDTVNMNVNPPWKILKGAVKKEDVLTAPNNFIEVTSMDALEKVEIPDYTSQSYNEESFLKGDIEEVGNLPPVAKGQQAGSGVRTAGQQFSMLEQVGERDQMEIDAIGDGFLKPLGEWVYALNQQFLTTEQVIRVLGEEGFMWRTVRPEDLSGKYDFKIESTARFIPKAVEAEQRANFVALIAPILMNPTGFPDHILELYKQVAVDHGYMKEAKILAGIIKNVRLFRTLEGGIMQNGVNGAANQAVQGANGNQGGSGSTPENTGQLLTMDTGIEI